MSLEKSYNPISRRIKILVDHWYNFSDLPDKRLCVWSLNADEHQIFQRFFELEETDLGQTLDLFMRFDTPFQDARLHTEQLIDNLNAQLTAHEAHFGEEATIKNWDPIPVKESDRYAPDPFIRNLAQVFAHLQKQGFEGKLVSYLSPVSIKGSRKYNDWLISLLNSDIPESLRFMLVDSLEAPAFSSAIAECSELIKVVEAQLDMQGAMQEIAAGGPDPAQPGVKFQQIFLELGYASTKGKIKKAERMAEKALKIAREEGWLHLQVAVFIQLGLAWSTRKNYEKAEDAYQEACKIAEAVHKSGDEMGPVILVQALFAKASASFAKRDLQEAMSAYEQAVPVANKGKDPFSLMEAQRMAGYCAETLKKYDLAWDYNYQAFETSQQLGEIKIPEHLSQHDQLPEKLNYEATLPYVGGALLRLAKRVGRFRELPAIREHIDKLCGPNWEEKVLTRQRTK